MVENFSLFGTIVAQLHDQMVTYFYLFLPVFFCLALAIDWFRNPLGSPDFLSTIKRAVIATLLIVGFQEISDTIMDLANGLADKISDLNGIDSFIKMAGQKASTYTMSATSLILGFNDLVIGLLSFVSYIILFFARYVTVAIYHFMWATLTILSPILILFTLFKGTLSIPMNLFRSLVEVASYKIIWAVLSVMLTSLAFGNEYAADGNYLTVIILNFIIALAMLGTPMVVKSLIGNGLAGMSESLGAGAVMTMVSVPMKAASAMKVGREVLSNTGNYARDAFNRAQMPPPNPSDFNITKADIPRGPINYATHLPPPPQK
jgi:hypothetical protein